MLTTSVLFLHACERHRKLKVGPSHTPSGVIQGEGIRVPQMRWGGGIQEGVGPKPFLDGSSAHDRRPHTIPPSQIRVIGVEERGTGGGADLRET